MWSFAQPAAFLLLPLPLLAAWLLRPAPSTGAMLAVPETVAHRLAQASAGGRRALARGILAALLWCALVVAVAGPRALATSGALPASGRDVVLALDLSGSMEEADFTLDGAPARRIDAVKRVAATFVRGRVGDRVGLVVFGDKAYYAAPPSHDVAAVARAIEEAAIGISGRSTAISEGIGLALKRLEASPARSRVVILLSDGINTGGSVQPLDAAQLARRLGVRIHTIALGVHDSTEAPEARDAVDARTLKAVAEASGGETFRVRSTAHLDAVARAIDRLEPSPFDGRALEVHRELWIYPAVLALGLALLLRLPTWRLG